LEKEMKDLIALYMLKLMFFMLGMFFVGIHVLGIFRVLGEKIEQKVKRYM